MKIFNKADHISNNIISASTKTISGNTDTHGHNFFEMEFIIDGAGIYKIDNGDIQVVTDQTFFWKAKSIWKQNFKMPLAKAWARSFAIFPNFSPIPLSFIPKNRSIFARYCPI